MSKKRRRRREKEERSNSNLLNNSPFGINPLQLISMLGSNIDMSQIGNMLSSMKMDGLDLGNFNIKQGLNSNATNTTNSTNTNFAGMGLDLGALQNMMNNLGLGNISGINNSSSDNLNIGENKNEVKIGEEDDENLEMLQAIKVIINPSKVEFIDKVIEAYKNGYIK
ncbi:hypothetical protein [Caproiciproducens sp. MSJ-32]|mgnify:CR=1 FL=1|uniref:hypothetical protein n=1 Tax=Caproiciproducens sp. MSJ-32 TaxID=2841527 RepID=UPI001C123C2B|nr:hypothetical protein [Caproiciproducens sp. MSJ-32]MBU5453882.1 hypothetical protein [Caproiciproducens sp. MSJ-32]